MDHTPYPTRDYDIEILLRAQTMCQVFSSTAAGLTVFKRQRCNNTTQESDLLFGAVQECDVHVRATDRQRYPRHTSTGAEVEHVHAGQVSRSPRLTQRVSERL